MMKFKIQKTARGFPYAKFVDRYGQQCSIQISSLADDRCIWLGSDEEQKRHPVTGELLTTRMHLNQDDVRALLPLLERFVETGELE